MASNNDADAQYVEEEDVVEEHALEAGDDSESDDDAVDDGLAEESIHDEDIEEADDGPKVPSGPDVSVAQFRGHTDAVYCIAVSHDGRLACSGGGDDVAHIWSVNDGTLVATLTGHADSVVAVAWSASDTFIATGGYDSQIKIWDPSGALLHTIEGPSAEIEWLAWHPKGDVLLAGSADNTSWMWQVTKSAATYMQVFAGHEAEVTCGGFTGSGKAVATASNDITLRVWNPKTGACMHTFSGYGWHTEPINTLVCAADKPLILTGSQDGTAKLVNITTQKVVATIRHKALGATAAAAMEEDDDTGVSIECGAFCESHQYAASGATDGSLLVWDIASGSVRHRMVRQSTLCQCSFYYEQQQQYCAWGHDEAVTRVAWVPNQPILVASTADGRLTVWDGRDGRSIATLTGHTGIILDMALAQSPTTDAATAPLASARIVTAGDDGVCRVYAIPA